MAYEDWTTISSHKMELYKTSDTENWEFDINGVFDNPNFMVFFNSLRYNGNISGFAPYVAQVSGTKYKVVPRIRTTSTIFTTETLSNGSKEYPRVPMTRRIFVAGFLYPTGAITLNDKPVNIYTEKETFSSVNLKDGQPMNSWFWAYTVPSAYYKTGIKITIATAGLEAWAITYETDVNYKIESDGSLKTTDYNYAVLDKGECTILVVEQGSQG